MPSYNRRVAPAVSEDEFWETIDDAWCTIPGGDNCLDLLSSSPSVRDDALRFVGHKMRSMQANLTATLVNYSFAELRAWSNHFERAIFMLCDLVTSDDDAGMELAAFMIACGRDYVDFFVGTAECSGGEARGSAFKAAKRMAAGSRGNMSYIAFAVARDIWGDPTLLLD